MEADIKRTLVLELNQKEVYILERALDIAYIVMMKKKKESSVSSEYEKGVVETENLLRGIRKQYDKIIT